MEAAQHYRHGIRVMADYCSSGVWAICLPGERGPFRHQMITHQTLGTPPELVSKIETWVADCSLYFDTNRSVQTHHDRAEELNSRGRALAGTLKQHVGPTCLVVFSPIKPGGGRMPDEVLC
jgi:hypothetical protein